MLFKNSKICSINNKIQCNISNLKKRFNTNNSNRYIKISNKKTNICLSSIPYSKKTFTQRTIIEHRPNIIENKIDLLINESLRKNEKIFNQIRDFLENSTTNEFNGVELDLESVFSVNSYSRTDTDFETIIRELNDIWINKLSRGSISIKIPKNLVYLLEFFLKENFYMHHCTESYILVCKWLRQELEDKIPVYPHTLIGVGSVILNKENKLILIKENFSYFNLIKWKFVTGRNEKLESIIETCNRETKEETNLKMRYHGIIGISEYFPSLYKSNEICFFNFCSIDLNEEEIRKELVMDIVELQKVEFFDLKTVRELMKNSELTIFTEKILDKIIDQIQPEKSLDDNIKNLIDNKFILCPKGYEGEIKKYNDKFKSFKIYL